jgi:hypothetical protein
LARDSRGARWLSSSLPLSLSLSLVACGTLIGLGDLEKVDCVAACGGSVGASAGGVASGGTFVYMAGSSSAVGGSTGAGGKAGSSAGGSASGGLASMPSAGSVTMLGGTDSGGAGGEGPIPDVCPGGPEPVLSWKEHWFEHNQPLSRVYYDDCIALYFDPDVKPSNQDWMVTFLDRAWAYSLTTYGKMGNERLYVVVHESRYGGGHSATFIEASHDNHAVIDMGEDVWAEGDYDLPAHLLGFIVDSEGAHTKFGAPKADDYGNEGFPLIYKYDLYVALGLTGVANQALSDFDAISNSQPYPDTYWFRDWLYPVWRDHGNAKVFVNYMTLLQKYYPAGADMWMPAMNYGQYFHFMSGAAGVDLVPLARKAFQWHPDFDDEISAAKADFPDIKY